MGCLAYLSPFLYSFAFCYPRGDDYDGITRAMFLFDLPGAIYELGREWLTWSGRYAYHFLAVFLGKAADNRLSYGLVCCFIFLSYALAFSRLGCAAGLKGGAAFVYGLACLCALCAYHGQLPDLYLLTDSLTIIFQASLYLLFASALLALWGGGTGKCRWEPIIPGIVAIGVYEHAALAVFWTVCAALASQWMPFKAGSPTAHTRRLKRELSRCACWLLPFLLFSFLAPGNMQRKISRPVEPELQIARILAVPEQLCGFLGQFFLSPWPVIVFCLTVFARVFAPGTTLQSRTRFASCLWIALAYILFALSVLFLHAASDVPFATQGKLGASLEIYTCFALALCLYFLPVKNPICLRPNGMVTSFCAVILIFLLCASSNFQGVLANAGNGDMLLLADFMAERRAACAQEAERCQYIPDAFGLLGEIRNPDARRRIIPEGAKVSLVPTFPRRVFPVYMQGDLTTEPEGWPNLWAAWVYGLPALAEAEAHSGSALAAIKSGLGKKLMILENLSSMGLAHAWIYRNEDQADILSEGDWLIFQSGQKFALKLLLPVNPRTGRLMPLPLQNMGQKFLKNAGSVHGGFPWKFFAIPLHVEVKGNEELTAIWLGPPMEAAWLPDYLFASTDGITYYQMKVATAQERGDP